MGEAPAAGKDRRDEPVVLGQAQPGRLLGRYSLHGEIASGGMATVHFGRLLGPVGFSKTVAIKRLHPQFAKDSDFVAMFLDEARVAGRIQHPNVVSTLDVVALDGELYLVMEYIEGESLSKLIRGMRAGGALVPPRIAGSIVAGALYGLHAAHEAKNEHGEPLEIIHRDVSPQNVLVGLDGVPRVLDFGVAKAVGRVQTTREGQIKGKLAYMPPEQILGDDIDRRVDVYSAGVMLWEALVGRRLFDGGNEGNILKKILATEVVPPSKLVEGLSPRVDEVVMRAVAKKPEHRFATAWDFAVAIEEVLGVETPRQLGAFVLGCARESIQRRSATVRELESLSTEAEGTFDTMARPEHANLPLAPLDGLARGSKDDTIVSRDRASMFAIIAILAILAAGTMGAIALIVLKERDKPAPSASAAAAPSAEPARAERATLEPSARQATPATLGSALPSITLSAAPTPNAAVPTTAAIAPTIAPRPTVTAPILKPTATAPPSPCSSPYYFENGIKKIKPECR